MLSAQVCSNCKYCTDCPKRKDCAIRKIFYSESEYLKWRMEVMDSANSLSNLIFPYSLYHQVSLISRMEVKLMDERREEELKLHPTYSQD